MGWKWCFIQYILLYYIYIPIFFFISSICNLDGKHSYWVATSHTLLCVELCILLINLWVFLLQQRQRPVKISLKFGIKFLKHHWQTLEESMRLDVIEQFHKLIDDKYRYVFVIRCSYHFTLIRLWIWWAWGAFIIILISKAVLYCNDMWSSQCYKLYIYTESLFKS